MLEFEALGKDGSVQFSTLDPRDLDIARHEALGNFKRTEPNSMSAEQRILCTN